MWYRLEHGAIHLNSAGTDLPSGTWIAVRESGWYDLAERPPQVQERGQIVGLLEKDDMTPDGQRVTIGWGAGLPCSFSEVRSLSDLLTRTARIMSGFDGLLLYVRESENLDLLAADWEELESVVEARALLVELDSRVAPPTSTATSYRIGDGPDAYWEDGRDE